MNEPNVKGTLFWVPVLILSAVTLFFLVEFEIRSETTFQEFAEKGNLEELQKQIADGADINALGDNGFSALACAVRGGQMGAAKILLDADAEVSEPSADGNTPLHCAVQQENLQIIELLLDKGADPFCENQQGFSPFYWVVEHNCPGVKLFLDRGVEPEKIKILHNGEYLFCSSQSGCLPVLSLLLNQGVDVNERSATGATALHYAVYGNQPDAVRFLIEHGADVNIFNRRQWTPLHQAAHAGFVGLIRILVENGAKLEARDNDGHSPLLEAVKAGQLDAVCELLNLGADIEAEDDAHQTAQDLARAHHNTEVFAFIAEWRKKLKFRGEKPQFK